MKTRNLSLATVVLGVLAASYSACSAQGQDNTVPGGSTPSAGNSNSAGSTGSSGAAPVAGASPTGGAGAPSPSAGAPATGFAGAFNTGAGGATTSIAGAPGTAGAATGGAGAPATGSCLVKAGTIADLAIDDLEDGDNVIQPIGGRTGYWYTFNDGTAAQVPPPTALFKGTAPGSTLSPLFAATTSGPAFTSYGAGMGFDFNNTAAKSCPYDASAYAGIKFYAKANAGNMAAMTLKAMLKIPATTSVATGGTCAAMCDDHYSLQPPPVLTTTWTQYTITFAAAATATFAQNNFGTVVPFDKSKILAMQFQVAQNVAFDFSIDDITFF
ncbi:MAG: hypothetical protein WDO69_22820 [Pseudomonadota bacterium]